MTPLADELRGLAVTIGEHRDPSGVPRLLMLAERVAKLEQRVAHFERARPIVDALEREIAALDVRLKSTLCTECLARFRGGR
jgi:hypothetical protein